MQFLELINAINEILVSAHSLSHSCLDNVLAFFTLQLLRLATVTHYEKVRPWSRQHAAQLILISTGFNSSDRCRHLPSTGINSLINRFTIYLYHTPPAPSPSNMRCWSSRIHPGNQNDSTPSLSDSLIPAVPDLDRHHRYHHQLHIRRHFR